MDPKAALENIIGAIQTALDAESSEDLDEALVEARNAAADLEGWLSSGGFAPKFNVEVAEAFRNLAVIGLDLLRGER